MEVQDVLDRFERNRIGFWAAHKYVIVICLVALLCDALSTTYFMICRESDDELHPVVDLMAELLGPVFGPLIGFVGKAAAGPQNESSNCQMNMLPNPSMLCQTSRQSCSSPDMLGISARFSRQP